MSSGYFQKFRGGNSSGSSSYTGQWQEAVANIQDDEDDGGDGGDHDPTHVCRQCENEEYIESSPTTDYRWCPSCETVTTFDLIDGYDRLK